MTEKPRRVRVYDPKQGSDVLSSGDMLYYDVEAERWYNLATGTVACVVCGRYIDEEQLSPEGLCPECLNKL